MHVLKNKKDLKCTHKLCFKELGGKKGQIELKISNKQKERNNKDQNGNKKNRQEKQKIKCI